MNCSATWFGSARPFGIVVLVMALEFVFRNMFNSKAVDAPQVFNRNR